MERVRRFREEHPPKRATIHGQEWEYIASGRGYFEVMDRFLAGRGQAPLRYP